LLTVVSGKRYRRCQPAGCALRIPCRWLVRSCTGRGHLLSQTLRSVAEKRRLIVNKMVRMSHFCELAVRLLWHRFTGACRGTV